MKIGTGGLEFDDFDFSPISGFGAGSYLLFNGDTPLIGALGANIFGIIGGTFEGKVALADGGRDIVLEVNAVPEPGTAIAALLLTGLAFTGRARRAPSAAALRLQRRA